MGIETSKRGTRRGGWFAAAALIGTALNLRTTVASVPPLATHVESTLGISSASLGLLTALPVICMATFAVLAHRLAARFGMRATMLAAVGCIAAGNGLRAAGDTFTLLALSTLLAGLGVAVCGVLLLGCVKQLFPERSATFASACAIAIMLGAAGTGTVSVPLDGLLGSWQASLGFWAIPALPVLLLWLPVRVDRGVDPAAPRDSVPRPALAHGLPWRSSTAWLLAAFFSTQAALAYSYIAWLAPAFQARGWSPAVAGGMFGVYGFTQIATALVLPSIARRCRDPRPALLGAVGLMILGAVWLWAFPGELEWPAAVILGLGVGGGFPMTMMLIIDLAPDTAASTGLAAMVFTIGYTAGALAPIAVGALHDAGHSFALPFGLLALTAVAQFVIGSFIRPHASLPVGADAKPADGGMRTLGGAGGFNAEVQHAGRPRADAGH